MKKRRRKKEFRKMIKNIDWLCGGIIKKAIYKSRIYIRNEKKERTFKKKKKKRSKKREDEAKEAAAVAEDREGCTRNNLL